MPPMSSALRLLTKVPSAVVVTSTCAPGWVKKVPLTRICAKRSKASFWSAVVPRAAGCSSEASPMP